MTDQQERARYDFYKELITEHGEIFYAGKLLQRAASRFAHSIALISQEKQITYKELYFRACRFSERVKQQGIKPHDRVLLLFENSIEFYVAYFGVWQTGAVVAPLNIFLKEKELEHIVADAKPAMIAVVSHKVELFGATQIPMMTEADMDFVTPVPDQLPEFSIPVAQPHEMTVLLYTSGTTGFPKGVMLSSTNIMTNILQGLSRLPLDLGQRVFAILPLFHSFAQFAFVWGSILTGCSVILVPKIDRRSILEGLRHKPTIFLGVPALYGLLCLLKTADLSSVLYCICGGDTLPEKIRMAFELVYQRKLCNGYGLTETSPVISAHLEDNLCLANNVGRPLIGISCSIRASNGDEVPQGEIGVLWVKGDNVMLGYYNEPEKTREIIHDGFLNTGDFAMINKRGEIIICGREKDVIAHKGIKIYPPEIENVIMLHPAVIHVGVIGKPDEETGEVPIAYVQVRGKSTNLEKELRALCNEHLASYKVPRAFIVVDAMPLTATGKVDKKVLRLQIK